MLHPPGDLRLVHGRLDGQDARRARAAQPLAVRVERVRGGRARTPPGTLAEAAEAEGQLSGSALHELDAAVRALHRDARAAAIQVTVQAPLRALTARHDRRARRCRCRRWSLAPRAWRCCRTAARARCRHWCIPVSLPPDRPWRAPRPRRRWWSRPRSCPRCRAPTMPPLVASATTRPLTPVTSTPPLTVESFTFAAAGTRTVYSTCQLLWLNSEDDGAIEVGLDFDAVR